MKPRRSKVEIQAEKDAKLSAKMLRDAIREAKKNAPKPAKYLREFPPRDEERYYPDDDLGEELIHALAGHLPQTPNAVRMFFKPLLISCQPVLGRNAPEPAGPSHSIYYLRVVRVMRAYMGALGTTPGFDNKPALDAAKTAWNDGPAPGISAPPTRPPEQAPGAWLDPTLA